jgi:hypothetical protein
MTERTYKPYGRFSPTNPPSSPVALSSASGGAAGAASSNLEEGSLKNLPHYAVVLKDFGDGQVVCTGVFLENRARVSSAGAPVELIGELPEHFLAERDVANARRAKRTLRERVWMLRADRMVTLTKRGKFETTDDAWAAWKGFCRYARKLWGARWQFVVVPESHREGGFHLHVALNGYFDVGMLRRIWYRALGGTGRESGIDTPGSVNISGAVTSSRSRTRIANYLAKYLGKDFGSVFRGRRSLASSRGIPAPRVVRWAQAVHSGSCPIGVAMRRLRGLVPERLTALGWWKFETGGFHGFVISPLE